MNHWPWGIPRLAKHTFHGLENLFRTLSMNLEVSNQILDRSAGVGIPRLAKHTFHGLENLLRTLSMNLEGSNQILDRSAGVGI